nr:hypothetical protein [Tanacetum cinerariifolium]
MVRDIIHFNDVNLLELSELEASENHSAAKELNAERLQRTIENHSAAKELNAEVIEENISTVIVGYISIHKYLTMASGNCLSILGTEAEYVGLSGVETEGSVGPIIRPMAT